MEADYSSLALEMLRKTGELMKTNFWPRKANAFLHGEMFILNHMVYHDESALPSELAAAMNTSSARVAMALKSLETKGFVTRRIDTEDRRKINVSLTPRGRELVESHKEEMHRKMERILRQLGEEDARDYIRIVERMIEIVQSMADETETPNCRYRRHKEHWHD
jgi:DNA-binding MarR family transcriptional regulator